MMSTRALSRAAARAVVATALPVALAFLGCSSTPTVDDADAGDASTCDFVYNDRACRSQAAGPCSEVGNGLCYTKCTKDTDCRDPKRPFCTTLGLWSGGDFECNGKVVICMSERGTNRCP